MLPWLEIEIHILQKVYVTQTQNSKGREGGGVAKRPQLKFEILRKNRKKTERKRKQKREPIFFRKHLGDVVRSNLPRGDGWPALTEGAGISLCHLPA